MNIQSEYFTLAIVLLLVLRIFFRYLARMNRQQKDIRSRRTSVFYEIDDDEEEETDG